MVANRLNPPHFSLSPQAHIVTAIAWPTRVTIASGTRRGHALATRSTSLTLEEVVEQLEATGFDMVVNGGIAVGKRKADAASSEISS